MPLYGYNKGCLLKPIIIFYPETQSKAMLYSVILIILPILERR